MASVWHWKHLVSTIARPGDSCAAAGRRLANGRYTHAAPASVTPAHRTRHFIPGSPFAAARPPGGAGGATLPDRHRFGQPPFVHGWAAHAGQTRSFRGIHALGP